MSRFNSRHVVLALLLVGSCGFLLVSLRGPAAGPGERGGQAATEVEEGQVRAERQLDPAAPADVDFSRYAALARSDVFSEDRSKPAAPPKESKPAPLPPLPEGERSKPSESKSDFSGWSYVGYIELDGEKRALLQNDTSRKCESLAVGDLFLGARIEKMDREAVQLRSGSSRTTLSRPRDFPVIPLAGASAKAPTPAQRKP